ncbi:MAG: tRNA (adenosine(37)-N6)-dimethylallyltransferase MiaA [Myxococcales bacterium]|nr:tRNA (adenosine(37)-N6)-dimethylallyltransferase MiaA [Myxococcales bacterium]
MTDPLLVLVGPTASGKTELAIRLAEAINGEIISADSVQVYRHFEIGTGKPSREERARAPHHLIDVVEPDAAMDAAQWAELADEKVREIRDRGRRAIVCGGTFLWVRALTRGLADAPPADPAIRERHQLRAEAEGRGALHAELRRVDPKTAERLAENDLVRVSRALEVFELSGIMLSQWHADHAFREVRHPHRLIGIRHTPEALDSRIRARAEAMLAAGFVCEVESLVARGFDGARAMRSVGYKQVHDALSTGRAIDTTALAEQIIRATRVFARRQRTWLRDQPVRWLEPQSALSGDVASVMDELERSVGPKGE